MKLLSILKQIILENIQIKNSSVPNTIKADPNNIPKSIKRWVSDVSAGKRGSDYYIINQNQNLEYPEFVGSMEIEVSQFFDLKINKKGVLEPVPIGTPVTRSFATNTGPFSGQKYGGKINIPSGKILVVTTRNLGLGGKPWVYIYTGEDFIKQIENK